MAVRIYVHHHSIHAAVGPRSRTPYLATFAGADANKVAHYMLRWESTRGETGPWSETASATIGA